MLNIIKADSYRMVHSVAFYIALGVMLLMLGTSIYMMEAGSIGAVSVSAGGETVYTNGETSGEAVL